MSKRDVFERNIKALTRRLSFKRAIQDWELVKVISLSRSDPPQPCELCNTPFWKGAWIKPPTAKGRKSTKIAVGGTCLKSILSGSFSDKAVITKRRQEVTAKIKETYGTFVEHPGDWIKWIVEHVPKRLAPLAAHLHVLGMVPTDRDLNRLFTFHNANRRYPYAALLPDVTSDDVGRIPKTVTIDEATKLIKGLSPTDWNRILARRGKEYRETEIDAFASGDSEWQEAWRRLDANGQRSVAALAKLSDDIEQDEPLNLISVEKRLLPLRHPLSNNTFVWHVDWGLALIRWLSDEMDEEVRLWYWADRKELDIALAECRSVVPKAEQDVHDLEAAAFWATPPWYSGAGPKQTATRSERQQTHKGARQDIVQPKGNNEYELLADISCVGELLTIAKFRLGHKSTLAEQFALIQRQVRSIGHTWEEFKWWAERYATSWECRDRIDRLKNKLCNMR